ncbi:Uu.00g012260.m01.CDS01 [Anthostomella pinea]|uniref:Uu.00g012260.m01.CDS01 n=1 Tax=Anthostomella pinea TaxID=933095 RepID=A0AAI8VXZ2_9PEZI|nr:Uu.00g012260.m01.CDS01 [Anthostomella pinea]
MRAFTLFRSLTHVLLVHLAATSCVVPDEYALLPSPDGHFFQDSNNKPFFWQADTAWLLFHRLNFSECEAYLADRAAKGFNIVLAVGFTQIGIDSPNRNGDLTFINNDISRPNELYWAYIDSIVELAWSKGIRIGLVPAWGKYIHSDQNVGSFIDSTTTYPFGHFIGQRYPYLPKILGADTNPWWTNKTAVKADYAAGGVPSTYTFTSWSNIYNKLVDGTVDGERSALAARNRTGKDSWWPLMTIHPTNQWFQDGPLALASAFFGGSSWLTFDASQSGHADYPPNPPIPWWNARRGWEPVTLMYSGGEKSERKRPVLDNEAHYEGRYINGKAGNPYWNATDIRVGSWQAVFSGAAGVTYGANNVMQMYIPGLFSPDGSGPARSWAEDLHLPGSGQMQYIKKAVMDRRSTMNFSTVPAQELLVGDIGKDLANTQNGLIPAFTLGFADTETSTGTDDERITALRDSKGSWIMVYNPTGRAFSVEITTLEGSEIGAKWYDPTTGIYRVFDYHREDMPSQTTREFVPAAAEGHLD